MWRLLSREITHAYRDGHLSQADLELLIETRMQAKSAKFCLSQECLEELGIAEELEDRQRLME